MTKTPEQLAEEYADLCVSDAYYAPLKDGFLAGYRAAKDQLQPQPFHKGADVYIIDANNPLPKPMPLSIAEQVQFVDADKVMCNTTMEEIKAVDTGELMPITNLPTSAKWISVKERLPEEGKLVLTYGADGIIDVLARYRATKNSWKWGRDGEFITLVFDLTHWMPLPEAPQEEK